MIVYFLDTCHSYSFCCLFLMLILFPQQCLSLVFNVVTYINSTTDIPNRRYAMLKYWRCSVDPTGCLWWVSSIYSVVDATQDP